MYSVTPQAWLSIVTQFDRMKNMNNFCMKTPVKIDNTLSQIPYMLPVQTISLVVLARPKFERNLNNKLPSLDIPSNNKVSSKSEK